MILPCSEYGSNCIAKEGNGYVYRKGKPDKVKWLKKKKRGKRLGITGSNFFFFFR